MRIPAAKKINSVITIEVRVNLLIIPSISPINTWIIFQRVSKVNKKWGKLLFLCLSPREMINPRHRGNGPITRIKKSISSKKCFKTVISS